MLTRSMVLLGLLSVLTACSGAEPARTDATAPATPSTASAEAPVVSAAPSASPDAPPSPDAAPGTERLAYDVKVWLKDDATIRATLDVSPRLAVILGKEGPRFATCRAATSLGTMEMRDAWISMRGTGLSASACDKDQTAEQCMEKASRSGAEDAEAKAENKGDGRVIVRKDTKHKDGRPRVEDSVIAYDKKTHATVRCHYTLLDETLKYRDEYFALCSTLAIDASPTTKKGAAQPGALADAQRIDLADAPQKDKLQATVEGFTAAMGKRDVTAAKKFLLSPADCSKLFAKDAKRQAACKSEVQEAAGVLTELASQYSEKFEAGGIRLARGDGFTKPGKDANNPQNMFEVLVSPKGGDCSYETFLFAGLIGEDYRIFVAMKKANGKTQKPPKETKATKK